MRPHCNANTAARVYSALERTEIVETQRGVGTFVRTPPPAPVVRENREREISRLISRLVPEAAALGFEIPDLITHLQRRLEQEKKAHVDPKL